MTESLTLYKLIILYMLGKVSYPLTNAQISDFILEKEYTNYFNLQQAISELLDSNLIKSETKRNSSHYRITEEGLNTLDYFKNKISDPIQEDINTYLDEHNFDLRNEVAKVADYYKTTNNDYAVRCQVVEGKANLVDLTISVPTKEQAELVCSHWPEKSQEIYAYLMSELL